MNKQVVNLHIGGTGVGVGELFWKNIDKDYNLYNSHQSPKLNPKKQDYTTYPSVYFKENKNGKHKARGLFIDSSSINLDSVIDRDEHDIHAYADMVRVDPENISNFGMINSKETYTELEERINKEIELCDQPESIFLNMSTKGAFGSGTSAYISQFLKDAYPKTTLVSNPVVISREGFNSCPGVYNTVLLLSQLKNLCDMNILVDNQTIFESIAANMLIITPNFNNVNHLLGHYLAGLTSSFRFSSVNSNGFGSIVKNIVLRSGENRVVPSMAPIITSELEDQTQKLVIPELVRQSFEESSCFFDRTGKYSSFPFYMNCRGDLTLSEVEETISAMSKEGNVFKRKILSPVDQSVDFEAFEEENGFRFGKISFTKKPMAVLESSGILHSDFSCYTLINPRETRKILPEDGEKEGSLLSWILSQFYYFRARKDINESSAYNYWYLNSGMTNEDFEEAAEDVQGWIDGYLIDETEVDQEEDLDIYDEAPDAEEED